MSADITTDTTAPNSGVSLEVGATCAPGEYPNEHCTVIAGPDALDRYVLLDTNSEYRLLGAGELVRVVPTPPDLFRIFDAQGTPVAAPDTRLDGARFRVRNLDSSFPDRAPHKIARMPFAEWIDTEAAGETDR